MTLSLLPLVLQQQAERSERGGHDPRRPKVCVAWRTDSPSICRSFSAEATAGSSACSRFCSSAVCVSVSASRAPRRSEEHTSELQSQSNLVCRLLLEKKKKQRHYNDAHT